ncbi:MAG: tRNA pseudouridine(13) synthase TruD [Candidatus Lokiarchaeota archaeon]|nr:tRNA pseudouridine(13) synthase TruD [Candidatus Lokiarchaeota archaeon]
MEEYSDNNYDANNVSNRDIEQVVGIEVYSTSGIEGIQGTIKSRYKDFIVKEITHTGHVLEINEDYTPPNYSEETKDNYTTFNLIKVNKDTFEAVRIISKALGIAPKMISYAGLKDKRAISVQQASVRGNYIEELMNLKVQDIFIRNINPTKNPVKLGSNWGNYFEITIRNIEDTGSEKKRIDDILEKLRSNGFPNYFGLQRFGTFRPNSHLIGRYILENDFKKAFEEFVTKTYPSEVPQSLKARADLKKTGNLESAYDAFPKSLNYERWLIKYMIDNPDDYEGAINHLPNYLIKLLLSSFQSYLFNRMLSLRCARGHSLNSPVTGDIFSILDDENGNITQTNYNYDGPYDKYLLKARDLNRAKIVYPLIGYNTDLDEFPPLKNLLLEIFDKEGISVEIFRNKLLELYEFKGSFRPIITKPIGVNVLEYSLDDVFQGKCKLKIEFSLQKGSYATLLLRELIK